MHKLLRILSLSFFIPTFAQFTTGCKTADTTTTIGFKWDETITDFFGPDSEVTMLNFLGKLTNFTDAVGDNFYQVINDYLSLILLKTDVRFQNEYKIAVIIVQNEIEAEKNALKAQDRNWEQKWSEILKNNTNDGQEATYFENKLKIRAVRIINNFYANKNESDFEYYDKLQLQIWLDDVWTYLQNNLETNTVKTYYTSGQKFANKLWTLADATNNPDPNYADPEFTALDLALKNNKGNLGFVQKIIKRAGDKYDGTTIRSASAPIAGMLSEVQNNLLKLFFHHKRPLWMRQIVIPYAKTDNINKEITLADFDEATLTKTLNSLRDNGFDRTLSSFFNYSTVTSRTSGDLGLVTIDTTEQITTEFSYFIYTFLNSNQMLGKNDAQAYQISSIDVTDIDLSAFIASINQTKKETPTPGGSSFNDLVCLTIPAQGSVSYLPSPLPSDSTLAAFLDQDGLHLVQLKGADFIATSSTKTFEELVLENNDNLNANWNSLNELINHPVKGLADDSYLSYLVTWNLFWTKRNIANRGFDLTDTLKLFCQKPNNNLVNSDQLWDLAILLNETNQENIIWNTVSYENDHILTFINKFKAWFEQKNLMRKNNFFGVPNLNTVNNKIRAQNKVNTDVQQNQYQMDIEAFQTGINTFGDDIIWKYSPE